MSSVNGFVRFFPKRSAWNSVLETAQLPLQSDMQLHLVSSITAWGAGGDRHITEACSLGQMFTPAILFDDNHLWTSLVEGLSKGYALCTRYIFLCCKGGEQVVKSHHQGRQAGFYVVLDGTLVHFSAIYPTKKCRSVNSTFNGTRINATSVKSLSISMSECGKGDV